MFHKLNAVQTPYINGIHLKGVSHDYRSAASKSKTRTMAKLKRTVLDLQIEYINLTTTLSERPTDCFRVTLGKRHIHQKMKG